MKLDFRDIQEFLRDSFKYIIVIIIVLVIALYVLSFSQVVGPSMEPTHQDGEVMLLSKMHYTFFDVKRNDVIALESEGVRMLIKRVIGLPGETIEYKDNILYINGEGFEENIVKDLETEDFKLSELVGEYDVIPEDMYLVLGDNRADSYDSRDFGLVPIDDILGKCIFTIWPLTNLGSV